MPEPYIWFRPNIESFDGILLLLRDNRRTKADTLTYNKIISPAEMVIDIRDTVRPKYLKDRRGFATEDHAISHAREIFLADLNYWCGKY
jgi:hypothetical protein